MDFLINFSANFLANLLVGAGIVTVIALWMNKRDREERNRQAKREENNKAKRYLEMIKYEVENLMRNLPEARTQFSETGWGRAIRIDTPFWEVVEQSGELPRLIRPGLLSELAIFYNHLAYAKQAHNLVIKSWLIPNPETVPGMDLKLGAFIQMTKNSLDRAIGLGDTLIVRIDEEITHLQEQIQSYE